MVLYDFLNDNNLKLNDGLTLDRLFNLKAVYDEYLCPCQVVSVDTVSTANPCPCPTALDDIEAYGKCKCGVFSKLE